MTWAEGTWFQMNFLKAQEEFSVRYYLWSIHDFNREIDDGYPYLSSFKSGPGWKLLQFIRTMSRYDKQILMSALLKKFHLKALQSTGDTITSEEVAIRDEFRAFCQLPSLMDEEVLLRKLSGENVAYANRRRLRPKILEQSRRAFGTDQILFSDSARVRTKLCGWILETAFDFGGEADQVRYSHSIISEDRRKTGGSPIMSLKRFISLNSWLGLSSQTGWKYVMDEDAELICSTLIKLCTHFVDVAPKLLKGLDFEAITHN